MPKRRKRDAGPKRRPQSVQADQQPPAQVWHPFGAGHTWGVPTIKVERRLPGSDDDTAPMFDRAHNATDRVWDRHVAPAVENSRLPQQFVFLASAIQTSSESAANLDGQGSFLHTEGGYATSSLAAATSAIGVIGAGRTVLGGAKSVRVGLTGFEQGEDTEPVSNSIDKNLGAVQLEQGITGGLTGVIGMGYSGSLAGVGDVPIAGAVTNLANGALSTKTAAEDATASGKLGYQRRQARLDMERELPLRLRTQRFRTFLREYQDHARRQAGITSTPVLWWKSQRNGYARFKRTALKYAVDRPEDDPSDLNIDPDHYNATPFLTYLRRNRINEFGRDVTPTYEQDRDAYARARAAKGNDDVPDEWRGYVDTRSLGKVSSFAQRRKAETATLASVDAAGNVVEGIGNLTAGGDYGITKGVGKGIKLLKGSYAQTKKTGKRARRVHKLRVAKNDMGYGDELQGEHRKRGVVWGTRQFFAGNVDQQMSHARMALGGGGNADNDGTAGYKAAAPGLDQATRQALLRKLTKQCDRRINDLLRCLATGSDEVYERAKAILHVIAETNLAGAIQQIEDKDIDRYRALFWLAQGCQAQSPHKALEPPLGEADLDRYRAEFTRRSDTLRKIVSIQLQGVGG